MNIIELARQAGIPFNKYELVGCERCETDIDEALKTFARLVIENFVKGVDVEPIGYEVHRAVTSPKLQYRKEHDSLDCVPLYTATQLAAARHKALEEAAGVCEKECDNWDEELPLRVCAAAIRALKDKT